MITTVAIAGYRSLRDVCVDLGRVTVFTGANGAGKSNVYKALRLLGATGTGGFVSQLALEGGLDSVVWAGPENGTREGQPTQGTVRRSHVSLKLGFGSDHWGYLIDVGLPQDGAGLFARDAEIKREQVFAGSLARPAAVVIDRNRSATRTRNEQLDVENQALAPHESALVDLVGSALSVELLDVRRTLQSWRFYDHLRTDAASPARQAHVGTRTTALASDGSDVAAAWASSVEAGFGTDLERAVNRAFEGSRVRIEVERGLFSLRLDQPGLLRPLEAQELSEGTLKYLLLCAALLPARPGELIVLNEPESSIHASLIPALAELIQAASVHSQVVVVTHSPDLALALESGGARHHVLTSTANGTRVEGQGLLDSPAWHWPSRT